MNDFSSLFERSELLSNQDRVNVQGRFDKLNYELNCEAENVESIKQ